MNILKWLIAGTVGGAVGAAVWAAIAYYASFEIGWIAWGIGGLVGICVRVAAGTDDDLAGIVAAALAALSVIGGKYAATSMHVDDAFAEASGAVAEIDDDSAIMFIADQIIEQRLAAGEQIAWPGDVEAVEDAMEEADYPPEIWADAASRWDGLSPTEQADRKHQMAVYFKGQMESFRASVQEEAFLETFGLFDVLFFGLAVATAFTVGSGRSGA